MNIRLSKYFMIFFDFFFLVVVLEKVLWVTETERQRDRNRETETESDRKTETETQRQRHRERQRQRETETETEGSVGRRRGEVRDRGWQCFISDRRGYNLIRFVFCFCVIKQFGLFDFFSFHLPASKDNTAGMC